MKVFILIVVFIAIAVIQFPHLVRKKQLGEFLASYVLLAIGFILSLLLAIGVEVPNPQKGIEFLIKLVHLDKLL